MENPGIDIRCAGCEMPIIEAEHLHTNNGRAVCDNCLQKEPASMICDFCMAPQPKWQFDGTSLVISSGIIVDGKLVQFPDDVYDDAWAACDRCKDLIESDDTRTMAEQTLDRLNIEIGEIPDLIRPAALSNVEDRFKIILQTLVRPAKKLEGG